MTLATRMKNPSSISQVFPQAALVAVLACTASIGCGDAMASGEGSSEDVGSHGQAITGGTLVTGNAAPWSSVVNLGGCSALKVSARWYLSAWHCGYQSQVGQSITVTNSNDGTGGTAHTISQAVIHPTTLQLGGNGIGYDLVMVQLSSDNTIPSHSPSPVTQTANTQGTFAGYGCDNIGSNDFKKQIGTVTTVPYWNFAANAYAFTSNSLNPMICPGDSGGPFFTDVAGVLRLSGVNSTYGAGQGGSDWARVSGAKEWIAALRAGAPGKNDFANQNIGTFLSQSSNFCLNNGVGNRTSIEQCSMADSFAQRFRAETNGAYRQFRRSSGGGCLSIVGASTADGAQVSTQTCDNSNTTMWEVLQTTGDYRQYRNRHSGKCMRVANNAVTTFVTQATCQNTSDFYWLFSD